MQKISKYVPHTKSNIEINNKHYEFFNINSLKALGFESIEKLPYSIKVLLEAAIRHFDGTSITDEHIEKLAKWSENGDQNQEVPFKPARILLHDTTGLPLLVDLAAMREAVSRNGGDPSIVNPTIPVDLVVDHSVTVEQFGSLQALHANEKIEFERNYERFRFLRWAQNAFENVNIVPPSSVI
ncbi:aconitase family protein, partial [Aeromonas veronii]|nr:aconitase family protein [Aeromonas veronii]